MKKGILLMLCLFISAALSSYSGKAISSISGEEFVQIMIKDSLYGDALAHLKEFEGFRSDPYKCPANQWTIGYGHGLIGHWIPSITKNGADSLLRKDLNQCIRYIERDTKLTLNSDPGKVLALSLFVFNVGTGNWHRSTLRKKVRSGCPIGDEIVKWCHIGKRKSNHLLDRREFELYLYTIN